MKKLLLALLTTLVVISLPVKEVKAQDPIDLYEGIPLVIYPHRHTADMIDPNSFPNSLNQIKEMGVYGVVAPDVTDWQLWLDQFESENLKVIPHYLWGKQSNSHIWYYTNSHYTIWEAEGTDTLKGKATLYYSNHTNYFNEEDAIAGRWSGGYDVPIGEELIYGPGYPQNATYNFSNQIVDYTIEFFLKIKERVPDLPPEYLNDVVCTLMVTNQRDGDAAGIGEIDTIYLKEVRVSDFTGWNEWDTISFTYDLSEYTTTDQFYGSKGPELLPRGSAYFVQFKVIWSGLNYVNLYIDKIRVYDEKGRQLIEEPEPSNDITTLVNTYINNLTIIGWYGTDEPGSIDNYEPYRVVDNIIAQVSQQNNYPIRLHAAITGSWRGTFAYGNYDYGMAHNVYVADEFWLRARPKNIQVNTYIYHNPWDPGTVDDWKERNIALVTDEYYGRINKYDSNFAVSTQGGAYYFDEDSDCIIDDEWIIPSPTQINYHVNLIVMYGAKELRLDPFFSSFYDNCNGVLNTYGLIDPDEQPTENYYYFKNTLIPRLNGWFGKTLKQIQQTEQYPKIVAEQTYKFIDNFSGNLECLPAAAEYDLGFFTDSEERDYFMIVSRWYNEEGACPIYANLNENYYGFTNLSITEYISGATYTLLNDNASILISLTSGDAELFQVAPVIKYGGTLIADETAGEGITLFDDMIIENGATLYVSGNYYSKANITVKSGGKIAALANGKIIFDAGKGIIVDGNVQIYGTANNRLELEFNSGGPGVTVNFGGSLSMSYCDINNAVIGINAEAAGTVYIYNVNFTNCQYYGIVLFGFGNGDITPPHRLPQFTNVI